MTTSVLIVTHVPYEGPHRIADALLRADLELDYRCPLAGDALPPVAEHAGAIFMGGPMNVDQTDDFPALKAEREWIAAAHAAGVPLLGVCLGSQLIARALGATVIPGASPELGWRPITVLAAGDPLLSQLAPAAEVLHWHGDVFELPAGAELLASSEQTAVQAFRAGSSWGLLFHAEADLALTERWLAEDAMRAEAVAALGPDAEAQLIARARELDEPLREASDPMFDAFAQIVLSAARAAS